MSKNLKVRDSLCGNCKHFVAGGLCDLVRGQINSKSTCDLHEFGNPLPIDTPVEPTKNKLETNYKPGFMTETVSGDLVEKAIQLEHYLLSRGVPEEEVHRAVVAYFSEPEPPYAQPWPPTITGLDLAGRVDPIIVPDTGTPLTDFSGLPKNVEPFPTPDKSPYGMGGGYHSNPTPDPNSDGNISHTYNIKTQPYPGDNTNWLAMGAKVNSEPSMHGEHGFNATKAIPEWRYPVEQSQMYPVKIPDIILPPSGAIMESRCTKKLQESIQMLKEQFNWLTPDYINKAKELSDEAGGNLYLVRAATETLTDHRGEGEKYRRKLSAEELNSMTRTAIGKKMDINHQPELETDATILDAEFDTSRKEIQMLVLERDPQINDAIEDGKITAVSINGGMPRSESVERCDHNCDSNSCELCVVPKGVVLGEIDSIGMTWVVTDPSGMYYNGSFVPKATPGIKTTRIEKL